MDFRNQQSRRRMMVLMDALIIALAMVLAAVAHDALREQFSVFKDPPAIEQYLLVAALTIPMMLGLTVLFGLHRQTEHAFHAAQVVADQVKLVLASLLGITLVIFLTQVPLNRSVVALFLGFTVALTIAARFMLYRWRRLSHASRHGRHYLLLIGSETPLLERIIDSARLEDLPPQFVGILCVTGHAPIGNIAFVPVLGGLEALRRVLHEETIDEVVLATRGLGQDQFASILEACDDFGTPIRQIVLPDIHDGRRLGLERQYGLPFVTLSRTEHSMEALALKRSIDIVGSIIGLTALAPAMLAIAAAILLTMGSPVFFSQERIGHRGRRFRMHKFRSMVKDAEQQRHAFSHLNELDGPAFKIANDPRVTRFGRFLRKFSLDELPQLCNVLVGNMSLVGPRPLPVAEQQLIEGPLRRRLSMKPGCTGLWQVNGRSNLPFEEWMKLDLEYLDNWSNLLDLKLLLKTLPAIIAGRGAV